MKITSYTFDSLIIICCFWLNTRPLPYSRGLFPGKRMVRMCPHLIWSGCTSSVSCGVWELCWSLTIARRWRNSPEQTLNLTYLLLPKDHRTPFLSFLWAKEVTDSTKFGFYIKKKLERFFSTILLKHLFSNRDKRANRTKQTNKQTKKQETNKTKMMTYVFPGTTDDLNALLGLGTVYHWNESMCLFPPWDSFQSNAT